MATPGKTSIVFGVAAWVALAAEIAILAWLTRGSGAAPGMLSFLPILLLSLVVLVCLIVNLGLGARAWKEAPPGSKPIAGLLIGGPLALLLALAWQFQETLQ